LLEGKIVNLRVIEKDDVDFEAESSNDIGLVGEYEPIDEQISKSDLMKTFDNPSNLAILTDSRVFIIQKKDGTRIGGINHRFNQPDKLMEIGCNIVANETGKGYGTEATQLMVDYLFLSKNISRIQAKTDVRNKASQRVLEKVGFKMEGTIRKSYFARGVWNDCYLYSILREEWKEPKILTKTA